MGARKITANRNIQSVCCGQRTVRRKLPTMIRQYKAQFRQHCCQCVCVEEETGMRARKITANQVPTHDIFLH